MRPAVLGVVLAVLAMLPMLPVVRLVMPRAVMVRVMGPVGVYWSVLRVWFPKKMVVGAGFEPA